MHNDTKDGDNPDNTAPEPITRYFHRARCPDSSEFDWEMPKTNLPRAKSLIICLQIPVFHHCACRQAPHVNENDDTV